MSTWSCCSKSIYIYSSSAASNLNLYILHALVPVFIVSNQVQRALFDQAMNAGPAIILQSSLFNLPFNAKNLSQVDDSVRRVCIGEKHRLTSIYRFVRVCSPCYFSPSTGMPWVHQFPLFVIWLIFPSSNYLYLFWSSFAHVIANPTISIGIEWSENEYLRRGQWLRLSRHSPEGEVDKADDQKKRKGRNASQDRIRSRRNL